MIKRILCASRAGPRDEFADAWRAAVAAALAAPPDVRPVRLVAGTVLEGETPEPPHNGIGLQWFTDENHLSRYEAWLVSAAGRATNDPLAGNDARAGAVDPASIRVVVAREHVLRGQEWLDERRQDGRTSFTHMAFARRAAGLTQTEFFDRWQNHAGTVGAVPIPAEARGQAYVQNHPLPAATSGTDTNADWPYDAVNEVYFDDLDALRRRISWFADNLGANQSDLFRDSQFVVVREEAL
ncbi:EthD domain-containing protein [Frankia sp. AiPs1]|uniref:EthD domain-containing protein n=1 Tax=Frankia sp. AiPa1 TaxID=573492 RepID=UPI00202B0B6F|nr:EthD domain-containing protein [Frankia sp. AiPa1]MCL9758586.1 EthD domain-containing protein [Frankia sp. AiPa1]